MSPKSNSSLKATRFRLQPKTGTLPPMCGVISGDVADSVAAGCRALDQILAVLASGPCGERHVAGSASGTQTRFEILQGERFTLLTL